MSENNSGMDSSFISTQTSGTERQEQVPVGDGNNAWLNQLNGTQLSRLLLRISRRSRRNRRRSREQNDRILYNCCRTIIENYVLRNANTVLHGANITLALRGEQLSQQNQELTEENEKLKSEQEIRQEKLGKIVPVQATRFSISDVIE